MTMRLRFSAHSPKELPIGIESTASFKGNTNLGYDGVPNDPCLIDWIEGDVIYERIGTLKKRPKLVTTPGEFEIGKVYHSLTGEPWLCYARTPKGFLFKVEAIGALAELDAEGKRVHNHYQFLPPPVPTVRTKGEEWYIDRTDK